GRLDDARKQLDQAVSDDDHSAVAHLGLARLALGAGHLDDAEPEARRAIVLGGGAEAHLTLAQTDEALSRYGEARAEYAAAAKPAAALLDRALASASDKDRFAAEAYLLAGDLHRRLNEKGAALTAYRKYLQIARPDAPERRTVQQRLDALDGQ